MYWIIFISLLDDIFLLNIDVQFVVLWFLCVYIYIYMYIEELSPPSMIDHISKIHTIMTCRVLCDVYFSQEIIWECKSWYVWIRSHFSVCCSPNIIASWDVWIERRFSISGSPKSTRGTCKSVKPIGSWEHRCMGINFAIFMTSRRPELLSSEPQAYGWLERHGDVAYE